MELTQEITNYTVDDIYALPDDVPVGIYEGFHIHIRE